ncbi:MAG: hypothetical protein K1060chlam1_00964 [Candidatus Anoxychlamydiales bacterium]|nr:hypothetical protein [Candidatus Anoxychlamydiales bacterium]
MNEQKILKILIGEFLDRLNLIKQKIITRDFSFPKAEDKIKVAIGMRRSGKTYFVYQQILDMINNKKIPLSRILYINFEDDRLLPLDRNKLAKLIEAFYSLYPENHDHKCYLFLDEIQNVEDWPIVIRRFHDSKNTEIFLTGSSAKLLSKEIATSLRGRSLATEIWPYSFHEYMKAKNISFEKGLFDKKTQDHLTKTFHNYLTEGGFPEVNKYDADVRQRILQEYIDIVLLRDIIERHKIKNSSLVKYMILSMIHNVSNPFTINKFYNELKSKGYKTSKDILYEYADYIEDAYLAFSVPIFDKSIRKAQTNPKKIYAIDPGIVRAVTLNYDGDLGKLFENVIYLDLRRLGCKINYYLTSERYEIDFVIKTPKGQQKFFQVVWNADDKKTFAREKRALNLAEKELKIKGEIITLESYLQEGINLS